MNASIPVYNADGSLFSCASEQRLARLQSAGLIDRLVRSRKGQVRRAILFIRPGEPKPMSARSMAGTRYSYEERLEHGRAWDLKHLGGNRDGKTYAPAETRTASLQVVADCTAIMKGRGQIGARYIARVRGAFVRNGKRLTVRGVGTSRRAATARGTVAQLR
jgi:hypothetical protein